ncbi:DUF645 family protein [Vibrio cholerae]|nr:DUF645 family protein [Vibrio cholerae]
MIWFSLSRTLNMTNLTLTVLSFGS